jgi:WD40 repeat protein
MNPALLRHPPGREIQLSHGSFGHCLNNTQCFSPDGEWIVYDTRNHDARLAANGAIRMINVRTAEDVLLYQTRHQTEYGPGVGAASFSPDGKKVLFLGGIQNASRENPYSSTRRTGIAVEIAHPLIPVWMDARDIIPPFTPGALRGGTHAHTWSGDGQWISFTYNDYILGEKAKTDSTIIDTRTVGVMFPRPVIVSHADDCENKNGNMYAILVARVVKNPVAGSDEISKAFDECWIGKNGYIKKDDTRQRRAIAFQGQVMDRQGRTKTEIFVSDIPDPLPVDADLQQNGTSVTLPPVPPSIQQRRISFTGQGVSTVPRHWLRTTPDGSIIGFLACDASGIIQLWCISPNGGEPKQLTQLPVSISGPFNFSPDGRWVAYPAGSDVYITHIPNGKTLCLTEKVERHSHVIGAVNWSPSGEAVCYNRYVADANGTFLQIFMTYIPGDQQAGNK